MQPTLQQIRHELNADRDPQRDPLIGRVIAGKFRLDALIGIGGMGKVYLASHLTLERQVALKIMHPGSSWDEQRVQRFHREARASSKLTHPNAIRIIDFGQDDDGTLFMVMEWLRGRSLLQLLRQEFPLDEKRVAAIVQQICHALAQAHGKGLVHRDLKLDNVMVDDRPGRRDFVKVLDFGIAKILDPVGVDARKLTAAGMVCGTPEYMAPEQVCGESVDARSDIYALGVVLYQLLTGQLPFDGDSDLAIAAKQVNATPRPPQQAAPQLPISDEMQDIVLICLAKRPADRFQSAMALAHALDPVIAGQVHYLGSLAGQQPVSTRAATELAVAEEPLAPTLQLGLQGSLASGAMPMLSHEFALPFYQRHQWALLGGFVATLLLGLLLYFALRF